MNYPKFFDDVPTIKLIDPIGGFLGAFDDGLIEISYFDCVKLAGHSCPTVASVYLMVKSGLDALYPDTMPVRSQIKVEMSAPKNEGVTGVIANVISYITGAGDEGGFKGIGRKYSRNHLLNFDTGDLHTVRLTRMDSRDSVSLECDTSLVPGSPDMMPLMQKILEGKAETSEESRFKELWQDRVKAMLTDTDLQSKIITITKE